MSKTRKLVIPTRLPWEDRWTEPTQDQLLTPLKDQNREALQLLMEQLDALDGVEKQIVWYGTAWKWSIQYTLHDEKGKEVGPLAYIVPNPENAVIAIPMLDATYEALPIRRLNKYIRDALRSAKQAVELHWATWSPSAKTEVEHLMDLLRRKIKIETGGESKSAKK